MVDGKPTLTWTRPPAGTIRFYRIYRDKGTNVQDRYDETNTNQPNVRRSEPRHGNAHTYWVTAVDQSFNESPLSAPVISLAAAMTETLRREGGYTLVELLLVCALALIIFGATLTALTSIYGSNRSLERQNDNAEAARVALDRAARQLRNLSNPTVNAITTIDRAQPLRPHLPDRRPGEDLGAVLPADLGRRRRQ